MSPSLISPKYDKFFVGEFSSCYAGYSADPKIRENSASGGLITQLLCYLLEKKEIDGAVVTKLEVDKGDVRLITFIARSREEIINASGSHYLKADFSKVIKEILNEKGKFAVVATPCAVRSIRKAQDKIPGFREKIYCIFGLFCGMPFNKNIFTYIYAKTIKNKDRVAELKFRVGWPNFKMRIRPISGDTYHLSLENWIFFHDIGVYVDKSCFNCADALAEYSDISLGDAWLKDIVSSDNIGTNICICRTTKGERLITRALKDNKIHIKKITAKNVIESQKFVLYFKKMQKKYKLITVPTRILKNFLNRFSNRYPDTSAKIPILFYRFIFYFVVIYMKMIWKLDDQLWKNEIT